MPDDNAAKQSAAIMLSPGVGINPFGVSDNVKLLSPDSRFQTIGACATNHIESGYRFSYSDLLPGYLERYRRQLLQDSQIVSNDISVFYLPAVDVSLHYNSMTELDFLPGSGAFGVPNPVVPSPSQPRNSQSTGNKDDSTPRLNISSPRSIRKQADLYVSCFLQKLPKELVVQPFLLDFLEQAIDNLPFVADWNSEADSVSSDSGNEVFFEKFPVHAIVHLHVQPSTIRFLCLPTSRMQCLMVLPFLDAVFSTKRDDCDSVVNRVDNNVSRKLTDLASLQSDNQEDITGFTLKPKLVVGDIVSAGGLSVTAILKEFRVSIFHPYGESSSMRPESSSWGNARPCDSLTILVKDIQCHFSRTIEAKIVQMNPNVPTNECTTAAVSEPNKKPSSSAVHGVSLLSSASETMNSTQSGDNFGLHRNLYISGIFDIGVAEFTCDTRRTLEILDIYNSWYRSSLARRLFLGNDDLTDTADNATQPFDQSEVQEVAQQQSNAKSETVSDTIDTAATLNTIQSPKTSVGCESDYESQRDTVKPTTESQQLSIKTKKQPSSKTITLKETHCHTNCTRLNEARATTIGPCFSSNDHSTLAPTNSTSPDPTSKLTTLVGIERGASGSRNTSLRVASWNALTIFCVQLKKFDLNLYMGSAMGLTRLIVDQSFCEGHISVNSSGRKHTLLTAGLANSQFISEGGGVGGEFGLVDVEARLRIDDDPSHDPQHCLAAQVGGFQIRIEYMNTNILLFRVNSLDLMLYDEWRLKDVAQQLFDSGRQAKSVPVKQSQYTSLESDSESNIAFGSPPIFIRIAGEINWDQAQAAIVRSTTPDLLRSIHKVRDYFQEQVREGRLSLIGQVGRFGMFPMTSRQRRSSSQSMSFCSPARFQGKLDTKSDSFGDQEIDRLLQRHWQKIMYQALKLFSRERFRVSNLKGKSISVESQSDSHNNPVLSGSFQLSGNSLGIACFAGSFRSAPDWAVFNIQYPTACFETEAQRELPMVDEEMNLDLSEVDGWINVRQVLSFELGSPPEFQPQMAYVLRVRRGKPQNLKDLPIATIEEWLEFSFRGADNTVVNFVRHSNPSGVSSVIQLAHFPVSFSQINSQESSLPAFNVLNSTKSGQSVICPTRDVLTPVNEDDNNPLESGNNNRATTNTGNNESVNVGKDLLKEERPSVSVRSNPLKPPNEGELLFILPSLALRITTDQRQTMSRPTLSSLPSVVPTSLTANEPKSDNTSKNVNRTNSLVRHSKGSLLLPQSKPSSKKDNSGDVYVNSPSSVPSVKVSFQTDFHGFVQLGLIDVPWLPSLISSYLDERLNDYELSSAASWNANDINQKDIISRLRALSTTSSPMVQDARVYDIIHWSLSPECRWLLATNIGVPAFDRLLESVGFRKARVTIPKWLQRGIMDQLDNIASILLEGSLQLSMDEINEESKTSHQKK
ncbi:unnamed protein product [Heterobilharzia americana]|nr:unnamed protein product [Heterobilharzia americana]